MLHSIELNRVHYRLDPIRVFTQSGDLDGTENVQSSRKNVLVVGGLGGPYHLGRIRHRRPQVPSRPFRQCSPCEGVGLVRDIPRAPCRFAGPPVQLDSERPVRPEALDAAMLDQPSASALQSLRSWSI